MSSESDRQRVLREIGNLIHNSIASFTASDALELLVEIESDIEARIDALRERERKQIE